MKNLPITEQLYLKSEPIDKLKICEGLDLMTNEHENAVEAVRENLPIIKRTVEQIIYLLKKTKKSRLIYVGAGTSGRIGVQDGVELYPTFGWPSERVEFIIPGGNEALIKPIENAEDNIDNVLEIINKIAVNKNDVVFGIAASGNTPFTCKILELSKVKNAFTIAISNNPKGRILRFGDINIILNTKEEIIAGSTRLKAGTAQKVCLNIISSMVMTKLGYVKNGRMSNLIATNKKLKIRKKMIESLNNR